MFSIFINRIIMYRSNYPFGTEHEIPELENSLPFPPNSYFALLEVIKIHHVGGGLGFEDDSIRSTGHRFRVYADRRTIRCLYSKGRVGGRGGRGVALQGVGGMNRNLGENFIVYSRRVSTYKCLCHREGNSECKEGEEGEWEGGGRVVPFHWWYCGVEKGCRAGGCAHDENRCILLPA